MYRKRGPTPTLPIVLCILVVTAVSRLEAVAIVMQTVREEPKRGDTKRLGEKLIKKAATGSDDDMMAELLQMMNEATQRLELDFDAGSQTQTLQQRIIDKLDETIAEAAMRRQPSRRPKSKHRADKRRQQGGSKNSTDTSNDANDGEQPSEPGQRGVPKEAAGSDNAGQDKFDVRRGWGNLPPRDRDEVIQGVGEEFLEQYRKWIERYYKALQEVDE